MAPRRQRVTFHTFFKQENRPLPRAVLAGSDTVKSRPISVAVLTVGLHDPLAYRLPETHFGVGSTQASNKTCPSRASRLHGSTKIPSFGQDFFAFSHTQVLSPAKVFTFVKTCRRGRPAHPPPLEKKIIFSLAPGRKRSIVQTIFNFPKGSFGVIRSSEIENNGGQLRGRLPAFFFPKNRTSGPIPAMA